jgi:hypothetical protein
MSCQTCGHEAETVNGQTVQPHNFGCAESLAARAFREYAAKVSAIAESVKPVEKREGVKPLVVDAGRCEHGGCEELKKPWSGRGAKPKYCADGHK